MRYSLFILLILSCQACTQNDKASNQSTINKDSSKNKIIAVNADSNLLELSRQVLTCLKNKDFVCLSEFIHPQAGLRFSPYTFIDTASDKTFSKTEVSHFGNEKKKIDWGAYSAGEDEIKMTPLEYLQDFIYDAEFITAPEQTINQLKTRGTLPNNVKEIYPKDNFTDFYFPGFDTKYEGMDWRALRLVFRQQNGRQYLIAIIHNEWTT